MFETLFALSFILPVVLGMGLGYYRVYYLLIHAVFLLSAQPYLYRLHPAAWDWLCRTPFPWFDRLLVTYAEVEPAKMEPEIQRLIREVPGQRSSALRALTVLRARKAGRRLLLALDEYEMLDAKLREGVFTQDLLATLRESIQSHRRIIWAFSGNTDITELAGADWTSYLISVRTLAVPLFTPEETHLLLTQPLKHSALREDAKAKSALFWREFWGEAGIARIHAESGGWPYFVQLIAETAVRLANESAPWRQAASTGFAGAGAGRKCVARTQRVLSIAALAVPRRVRRMGVSGGVRALRNAASTRRSGDAPPAEAAPTANGNARW